MDKRQLFHEKSVCKFYVIEIFNFDQKNFSVRKMPDVFQPFETI